MDVRHRASVLFWFFLVAAVAGRPALAAEVLRVGFGQWAIDPDLKARRGVWLAGYLPGRRATAIGDSLYARAVVLDDGRRRVALVSLDLVGLMRPQVLEIRRRLPALDYVVVSSTHTHAAPDTIGLWGGSPFLSGVDPDYLEVVYRGAVAAVRRAVQELSPVEASYGTAEDADLLADSRLPLVLDPVLRVLKFTRAGGTEPAGLVVQWNSHPECLGPQNTQVTADFVAGTVAALHARYGCPVVYFTGPVGGLMAPPEGRFHDPQGRPLREGDFAFAADYGRRVAGLAQRAIEAAEPLCLTPIAIATKDTAIPMTNGVYAAARLLGLVPRDVFAWTGDPQQIGPPYDARRSGATPAIVTEVACLQLGKLRVACVPGEIYPELVYGNVQDPPDPAADFPDAPVEPALAEMLGNGRWMCLGLANDEIGYLIPRRQWDRRPPYAYGRRRPQYGEINSVGPDAARLVLAAMQACVEALPAHQPRP